MDVSPGRRSDPDVVEEPEVTQTGLRTDYRNAQGGGDEEERAKQPAQPTTRHDCSCRESYNHREGSTIVPHPAHAQKLRKPLCRASGREIIRSTGAAHPPAQHTVTISPAAATEGAHNDFARKPRLAPDSPVSQSIPGHGHSR